MAPILAQQEIKADSENRAMVTVSVPVGKSFLSGLLVDDNCLMLWCQRIEPSVHISALANAILWKFPMAS